MPASIKPEICNCLALRQAARHVSQLYDRHLAPSGLRGSQFSILARLALNGPTSIGRLAEILVMDRTTLARNIQPLQRAGLMTAARDPNDRRSRQLQLTARGAERVAQGMPAWAAAQHEFETAFGARHAQRLRADLRAIVTTELGAPPSP